MTIQELHKRITEISTEKGIHEQEIINGLLAHLDMKYAKKYHTLEDAKIVHELKLKIMGKLFALPNHKIIVNRATKYEQLFDLNSVELNLLNDAFTELESDGDVYSLKYEIGLTEQGVRKQRQKPSH
jgi:hypothetical protein